MTDVQTRLKRLVDPGLTANGTFDAATLEALRRFQRDRGLAADGIVGRETWRALTEAGFSLGDRLLWHASTLQRGDDVRELQHGINRLGFDAGPEDGLFGPLTRRAVQEFQHNVGLAVDGVAGATTVEALRRLHRGHQSGGVAVRARQREVLRRLASRGMVGVKVLLDPAHGGADRGAVAPGGQDEADVTWAVATRLAAMLGPRGAQVFLARGRLGGPTPSQRAGLANDLDVDLVLSIAVNSLDTPVARGSTAYYFGGQHYVSEPGRRLAERVQEAVVEDGWRPDAGVHPMAWSLLRETRMPTVVVEPGFLSSPEDAAALVDPARQGRLAGALLRAIERFLTHAWSQESPSPGEGSVEALLTAPAMTRGPSASLMQR